MGVRKIDIKHCLVYIFTINRSKKIMQIIKLNYQQNDNNIDFEQIHTEYPNNILTIVSRYLKHLNKLRSDIIGSEDPDKFLSYYKNDSCIMCRKKRMICKSEKIFLSPEKAYNKLLTFQNGIYYDIIQSNRKN